MNHTRNTATGYALAACVLFGIAVGNGYDLSHGMVAFGVAGVITCLLRALFEMTV